MWRYSLGSLFLAALLTVTTLSNVGAIPLSGFYPFGVGAGDRSVGPNDDESSEIITLNRVFPFYDRDHFTIVVNNNGLISFGRAVSDFTPVPFPLNDDTVAGDTQLIAPFWGDVDTTNGGQVWYRETTSPADLDLAQQQVRRASSPQASTFTPRLVFIATWEMVGYFNSHNDKTNTFQCVLVSDEFMSFAIFLYADGLIQWTTGDASEGMDGLGGIPAQVGFNAGDRVNFASHEYSQTADILNIASSSIPEGVSEEGVLVYRVDGRVIANCVETADAELTLTPRLGNLLGGTPVLITGLCLQPGLDFIQCFFDGIPIFGRVVDDSTAQCTTPVMSTLGNVAVTLRRFRPRDQPPRTDTSSTFTTVSPIRAHQVSFAVDTSDDEMQLLFRANDKVQLTWMPRELVPTDDFEDLMVTIELSQQMRARQGSRLDWRPITGTIMSGLLNSGSYLYTIPEGLMLQPCTDQKQLCPVAFRVSATLPTQGGRMGTEVAIWSAIGFLRSDSATDDSLIMVCNDWFTPEPPTTNPNRIPDSVLGSLTMCPPTLNLAATDSRFRRESMEPAFSNVVSGYADAAMKFYSPKASVCYLEIIMNDGSSRKEGQQCCYDDAGTIVTGQQAGGSVDQMSPFVDFNMHSMNDLLPYAFCCRAITPDSLSVCNQYEGLRPSLLANAEPYELTVPACTFGDPHIVTLDGHKYTFNGKGEFTLVETHDGSFTLQGRMEEATDSSSTGTVFTSLVAQQAGAEGKTVEFRVSRQGDLEVLVDRRRVNFAELSQQDFQQVVVINRGNNTAVAEFSGGVNIEIRVQNSIISVMLVTLPNRYRSLTRGLMGNYNRNTRDDFIPKDSFVSIPVDSSVEEIFAFGRTWIINDALESLFVYNRPNENFEAFRDADFEPLFVPVFDDPALEQRADEICGDDEFCRFDIAATKNEDIGMSTMMGVRDFDMIVELAEPIVCEPPCENGVCVDTNTCSCSVGFSGETCEERLVSECDVDMCQNNATCVQHVRSFTCNCQEGFIGIFCQEREPPFSVKLINSSPRTSEKAVAVEFLSSKPLSFARCILYDYIVVNCSSGRARFSDVLPGSYRFVVRATATTGERAVERRTVFVCSSNESFCGVNFINEGVTVDKDCANVQFTSCGPVDSFRCKLNGGPFALCRSPMRYCGLEVGSHRFQALSDGVQCKEKGRLSVKFDVI